MFGPKTEKWLNALSESTRSIYKPGIVKFQEYLNTQADYPAVRSSDDFLKAVQLDSMTEKLEHVFVDRELMKGFSAYMLNLQQPKEAAAPGAEGRKKLTPKTVRTYVGGVQSLGKYWKVSISTDYADLPPAIETNEKYAWAIEQVGDFVKSMDSPMYRCISVWFLQTGLSNIDLLTMRYGKIRSQFENGTVPICLNLIRTKTRRYEVRFRSFIGTLGVQFFKEYLAETKPLGDNDLIFPSPNLRKKTDQPISSNAVEGYFTRRAAEFLPAAYTGRNPCCPSSLRTAFRTFLADAECPTSYIEYLMGHNLSQDLKKTYTNKSDDSWRATYAKYEPALTFKL